MFEKTKLGETRIMIRLCLVEGRDVEGEVLVGRGDGLAELLNDERAFLPVETPDAGLNMIAKSAIRSASVVARAPIEATDPYALLRVERTATDTEVREAWMERLKATHPDRLAALRLDDAVIYEARKACVRVNAAYDRICAHRQAVAAA